MSPSPALDPVRAEITKLAWGRRRVRFVRAGARVLFYGCIAVALLAWFVPLSTTLTAAAVVLGIALAAGVIAAAMVPIDPVAVAKRYDDQVGIKDLVSSSLQLEQERGAFAAAVREDAAQSTGRAGGRELYPLRAPLELRWLPAPLAVGALAALIPLITAPPPPVVDVAVPQVLHRGADELDDLLRRWEDRVSEMLDPSALQGVKNLTEKLREPDMDKRKSLAELARLASQLDKERQELDSQKLQIEKNSAKLARGEDFKDAKRDMDGGRYREAANKVRKKVAELQKKLEEEQKKAKPDKLEIEKLKKRIAKLKNLLAELEELHALGKQMGFFGETLEILERIEGALGELGEFDGMEFDEAMLGRLQPGKKNPGEQDGNKLLVRPSNDAGEGHVKKTLGNPRRALTEREEGEAKLREGKGKSQFGQVKTANDGSRSRTAYDKAYLAAKRAAEDAIYRQNVPPGYRRYIRRYFEVMQPDDQRTPVEGR